jgi:hypothetical protein
MNFMKINWDALGVGASVACAVHCAVLPLLFTTFPLFGINIIHNPFFEWFMISLALGIGVQALRHGYVKHHHSKWPIVLLLSGFFFLICKEWLPGLHTLMVVVALVFIVTAHYINFRFCRVANHCHQDDCNH